MAERRGAPRGPRFTEADDMAIMNLLESHTPVAQIADRLGRSESSIKKRIDRIRDKQRCEHLEGAVTGPSEFQIREINRRAHKRFVRAMRRAGYGDLYQPGPP